MIEKASLTFLKDLKRNNDREWFEKNKSRYLRAKDNMMALTESLLAELCKEEKKFAGLTGKDCIYRIYRDVRFAKDKRPYKHNLSASFNEGGRKAMNAGYYLHIEPGKSFLAGGIWLPPADILKKIRQEIDYNGKDIRKILNEKKFKAYYGAPEQENKLKTTPKGYEKDHPDIDLLRLTSFIVWHDFTDKEITSPGFVKLILKGTRIMKPFLDFLNVAISD